MGWSNLHLWGQHTYTASYNSIKWTNQVVLVVFQTQVNFNLIPTLLWAKGLSEAALHMASCLLWNRMLQESCSSLKSILTPRIFLASSSSHKQPELQTKIEDLINLIFALLALAN